MRWARKVAGLFLVIAVLAGLGFAWISLGVGIYRVDNGSMTPTLPVGSVVIIYKTDNFQPRDILTYRDPRKGGVTTHTFLGYNKDGTLITHGDANPSLDPPLPREQVVGKVWRGVPFQVLIVMLVVAVGLILISVIPVKKEDQGYP